MKAKRAFLTYSGYRIPLLRALKILGRSLLVGDVRRFHLSKIEQALIGKASPTTIRDTISCVQGVFSWAVRNDILDTNPLVGYVKPAPRGRNRIITSGEFQALLRATAKNPAFRRILFALRWTGCRPAEVRELTWPMVDLEQGFWVLPQHKTVTMQKQPRPRIIPLPPSLWRLCQWLAKKPRPKTGHVFVNMIGRPYSKDAFVQIMARLRERARIPVKGGEQIVLYSARHTFGSEIAGKVSDIELAELMGHTSTHTSRRYVHLSAARLRDIQRRAHG